MTELHELNGSFALPGELTFESAAGGVLARLENASGMAEVALLGAQVLRWQPVGQDPVLWVSPVAAPPDKPVRGGVPVCWPWFGPHPTDPAKPNHGFVRDRPWTVVATAGLDGRTTLTLGTKTSAADNVLWPHQADLTLRITAGSTLRLELITHNTGPASFTLSEALHHYFHVGDITQVQVDGFDGLSYLDKVANYAPKEQRGSIAVDQEVDRIYLGHVGEAVIRDAALRREIVISKSGSASSVVWNPWAGRAKLLGDMGPDGYRGMICVETANAGDDLVELAPGGGHTLTSEIRVRSY